VLAWDKKRKHADEVLRDLGWGVGEDDVSERTGVMIRFAKNQAFVMGFVGAVTGFLLMQAVAWQAGPRHSRPLATVARNRWADHRGVRPTGR